jgi:1-acyl-sn-glycerol-3-phosphate acyltransferase
MFDFKPGAKMIGNKFNLKVQPVIIINTRAILDSKKLTQTPGIVKVIYLDPIQADRKTDWFEQTEQNMKAVFEKEINN